MGVRQRERANLVHNVEEGRLDTPQWVSFVVGIIVLGWGLYLGYDRYDFVRHSMISVGTVESCKIVKWSRTRQSRRVKIAFKPYRGKRVRFQTTPWTSDLIGPTFYVGQEVVVRYDYRTPTRAFVFSWEYIWGMPILLCCVGIGFLSTLFFG